MLQYRDLLDSPQLKDVHKVISFKNLNLVA